MHNISNIPEITENLPIIPRSKVKFIFKSGREVEVKTPLRPQRFVCEYKRKNKKILLIGANNSYTEINKNSVDFYQVEEI